MRSSATASKASASAATRRARPSPSSSASPSCPAFLSVADDPTLATFDGTWLSGHYDYDDEGQAARRVDLIQDGVLKTFLMSRLPIASFFQSPTATAAPRSGRMPTGRQGNLIVTSSKTVSDAELAPDAHRRSQKAGQALRPLLRGHLLRLRRHHAPLAAGLPGHPARRLPRLRRWPPRRTRPRRQHRRHAAGRAQQHPRHRRQAGHLQRRLRRRVRQHPRQRGRPRHARQRRSRPSARPRAPPARPSSRRRARPQRPPQRRREAK